MKWGCEDCGDFTSVELGEDVSRGVGVPISWRWRWSFEIRYTRPHTEFSHGKIGGELSEMFNRIAWWESVIAHGETDLLKGFSSGGHEWCFRQCVRLPSWESCLTGIFKPLRQLGLYLML